MADAAITITPRGGANEVGRSCYQVTAGERTYLVDCGLKQSRLTEYPMFRGLGPGDVDGVFVTHAHIDHIGALPVAEQENLLADDAPIITTRPTSALASILLHDSLQLHKQECEEYDRPQRYTSDDVEAVLDRMETIGYEQGSFDDLDYIFGDAGHLLGSAWIALEYAGTRVVFSGDLGGRSAHLRDIAEPPAADALVLESTYGDQLQHRSFDAARSEIFDIVRTAQQQDIPVLIPTFAVGRAQELLQLVREREDELADAIGDTPDIVYDGMITDSMAVYEVFCQDEFMNDAIINYRINSEDRTPFTPDAAWTPAEMHQRERLLDGDRAPVIVAPSGMLTGGWSPYYLRDMTRHYDDARLVFVGYQAEGTPGRDIQDASDDTATVEVTALPAAEDYDPETDAFEFRDEELTVPTDWVRTINGLSGHAAGNRLMEFARSVAPDTIALVHGAPHAAAHLQDHLTSNTDATTVTRADHHDALTIESARGPADRDENSRGDVGDAATPTDALADIKQRQQELEAEMAALREDIDTLAQHVGAESETSDTKQ